MNDPKPAAIETITVRLSAELASAIRGYAIARDADLSTTAAEIMESRLIDQGLLKAPAEEPLLSRLTPTDGKA